MRGNALVIKKKGKGSPRAGRKAAASAIQDFGVDPLTRRRRNMATRMQYAWERVAPPASSRSLRGTNPWRDQGRKRLGKGRRPDIEVPHPSKWKILALM